MCVRLEIRWLCLALLLVTVKAQDRPRTNPAAIYTFAHIPDSYVLSELPLSALLKVKRSVNSILCTGYLADRVSATCPAPPPVDHANGTRSTDAPISEHASSRSLPDLKYLLTGDHQSPESNANRKTYSEHGLWKGSEESGKIQKLFQFSITALAFLAFGGYLLCMIVQAIKSKGVAGHRPIIV